MNICVNYIQNWSITNNQVVHIDSRHCHCIGDYQDYLDPSMKIRLSWMAIRRRKMLINTPRVPQCS